MPSKSTAKSTKTQGPTKEVLEAIERYLAQKPDFQHLIDNAEATKNSQSAPVTPETAYEKNLRQAVEESSQELRKARLAKMPVLPQEEEAGSNLTDQVAKESKDSTASTHQHHTTDEKKLATMDDHKATPGPVMAENLGQPTSKEELKKRAEELNK